MKTRCLWRILLLAAVLMTLAACIAPGAAPTAVPPADAPAAPTLPATAETPAEDPTAVPAQETAAPAQSAAANCPAPTEGTQVVINTAGGYCFLTPASYTTTEYENELVVMAPVETEGHRERAFINVEPANGRTASDAAGALEATVTVPAGTLTRSAATLGGEEAVVLEVLPGQDLNRMVYAVHGDTLYSLMFVPLDPEAGEAYTQVEELYALLMESFTFLDGAGEAGAGGTEAPAAEEPPLLSWEGLSAQGACMMLNILPSGEAQVGACGDTLKTVEFNTGPDSEWAAVLSHFAPIEAGTDSSRFQFQGQGSAGGPAWERALNTWAWFTAQELDAGRTSAAGRTALAWKLDEVEGEAGQCAMLLVTAYGYAYANTAPCDGNGPATPVAQGWLETAEWETLEGWLTNGARIEDAAGYLDAQGSEPLAVEELAAWANGVYSRLAE